MCNTLIVKNIYKENHKLALISFITGFVLLAIGIFLEIQNSIHMNAGISGLPDYVYLTAVSIVPLGFLLLILSLYHALSAKFMKFKAFLRVFSLVIQIITIILYMASCIDFCGGNADSFAQFDILFYLVLLILRVIYFHKLEKRFK